MSAERERATLELAVIRTELANSRTFMSYTLAAITLLVSGIAFMKLFEYSLFLYICCWLFIIAAVGLFTRGVFLYRKTKRLIEKQKQPVEAS